MELAGSGGGGESAARSARLSSDDVASENGQRLFNLSGRDPNPGESPFFISMETCSGGGDGVVSTTLAKLPTSASAGAGSEDRLSALPNDILVLILNRLRPCGAAQTSVLSRRWRHIWTLLPLLHFRDAQVHRQVGPFLEAHNHEAALLGLSVWTKDAAPESVSTWLPVAARRLSGWLIFHNRTEEEEEEEEEAFELPCLERATDVSLHLGFLGLAVPPAGVFAQLTGLCLDRVRLYGPGDLGDTVSWPRCPCLQDLTVCLATGLDNLAIHSDSLRRMKLIELQGLRQLNIVAPALEELKVAHCFAYSPSQPVSSITAPQLATLEWEDLYDPSFVHLGEMNHLRLLRPPFFFVYWHLSYSYNRYCLSLLRRFKVIECLILTLAYLWDIDDYHYVMEDMTMLPDITILHLKVLANGHAFGASAFHVLRMCSSIKRLMLSFVAHTEGEAQTTCPPGCFCGEHQNWKTEHLSLNRLKEVEVTRMRGSEHEVTFVKQLFIWTTSLEKMRVFFDESVTESVAKELSQVLRSFTGPGIRMEIHTTPPED